MNPQYALFVLKAKRHQITQELSSLNDNSNNDKPIITKYKNQIASIDFAIEVLETHLD
jgi:hypothetical protein